MNDESMLASFRALMMVSAYRDLSERENSFIELFPEYLIKKRIAEGYEGRSESRDLSEEASELGDEINAMGYSGESVLESIEEELGELREKGSVIDKGVEKVLEASFEWVSEILENKEFSLEDLERMHGDAPEKFRPMISDSIQHLKAIEGEAGSTGPNIQRFIS